MTALGANLTEAVRGWIARTYDPAEWQGRHECFRILSAVRLPDDSVSDLVSLRHCHSGSPDVPDLFVVGLWSLSADHVGDEQTNLVSRQLQVFHAWYAELEDSARCCGTRAGSRFEVRGNVVGASVHRSPLTDVLSDWGRDLSFWTWHPCGTEAELLPYYGHARLVPESRRSLERLLSTLSWESTPDR